MVAEILFTLTSFILGWGYLRRFAPTSGFGLVMAASYPFGVTIIVVATVILLAIRIPFHPLTPILALATALIFANWRWNPKPTRMEIATVVLTAATIAVATAFFAHIEWTALSHDGLWAFYIGDDIFHRGTISDGARKFRLSAEPIYLPVISAFAASAGITYFKALHSLMAACGAVSFAILGHRALAPPGTPMRFSAIGLPALAAIALLSTPLYLENVLQMKTHVVFAFHMLVGCAALYFAERERAPRWFALALSFIAPMILMRHESGVSALAILVVAASLPNIPLRLRLLSVGMLSLLWAGSYLYLLGVTTYFDGFVRGLVYKKLIWIGLPPALFGLFLVAALATARVSIRHTDRAIVAMPAVMTFILVMILAGHAVIEPGLFLTAMRGFVDIFTDSDVGASGFGAATAGLLILAPLLTPRTEAAWTILVPSTAYFIILLLAGIHLDGQPHWGQGAALTRMASQALPTILFYVLLKYGLTHRLNGLVTPPLQEAARKI